MWSVLVSESNKTIHNTLDSPKDAIDTAWEARITPDYIRKACWNFRPRLEKVMAMEGKPVKD